MNETLTAKIEELINHAPQAKENDPAQTVLEAFTEGLAEANAVEETALTVREAMPEIAPTKRSAVRVGAGSRSKLRDLLHSQECTLEKLVDKATVKSLYGTIQYELANDVCAEVIGGYILHYEAQDAAGQASILQMLASQIPEQEDGTHVPLIGETDSARQKLLTIMFWNRPELLEKDTNGNNKASKRASYYIKRFHAAHDPIAKAVQTAEIAEAEKRLTEVGGITIDEKTGNAINLLEAAENKLVGGDMLTKEAERAVTHPPTPEPKKVKFSQDFFVSIYQTFGEMSADVKKAAEYRTALYEACRRMNVETKKLSKALAAANERIVVVPTTAKEVK